MGTEENEKKIAWVFGGSSDIGMCIIASLRHKGYEINFTWNSNKQSAEEICNRYQDIKAHKLDLGCEQEVDDFCEKHLNESICLFVYCAGINNATFCDELQAPYLEKIVRINYTSAAKIFNKAAWYAKRNKYLARRFIFISSVASTKVNVGNTLYGSTKLAMERYLVGLASELARFNVKTLCISPGFVRTKMVDKYCEDKGISINELIKRIPTREFLQVEDVANVVVAFASGQINTTGSEISLGNGERFM
ncbi:SDR family NAD(P)-dependent oxidoreductase [Enterobacter asburiae]|uniref:SDR family NAD(P)-dependent oxidoreductase n=1 Tax=Enterobacter asburiae TaxID=61645 RepID=UPI0011D2BEF7|nr:SDR family oxidoreductase [Enterobacter asburiae]